MILIAAIITGIIAALVIVFVQLRKAPVGYEDNYGFHVVQRVKGSGVRRYRKSKQPVATALAEAEVRS